MWKETIFNQRSLGRIKIAANNVKVETLEKVKKISERLKVIKCQGDYIKMGNNEIIYLGIYLYLGGLIKYIFL